MRTHEQIISDGGGYQAVASKVPSAGLHRVRFWERRRSIPAEFWKAFVDAGLCTLDELAEAAEARRVEKAAEPQGAAA